MGIDWPINSSITTSLGSLLSKSFIKILIAYSEIKKIIITEIKTMFGGTFKIWNKKNNNNVVAKDAKLPGIFLILPIPNNVTNKKFILLCLYYLEFLISLSLIL